MGESLEEKLKIGEQYYEEHKLGLAWKQFTDLRKDKEVAQFPDILLQSLNNCATLLMKKEKYWSASKFFESGKKIGVDSPDKVVTMRGLMKCFRILNQQISGIKVYRELEDMYNRLPHLKDSNYPNVLATASHLYLGLIHKGLMYHKEFKEVYSKLERDFSNSYDFLRAAFLKAYFYDGDYKESIKILHRMLVQSPPKEEGGI